MAAVDIRVYGSGMVRQQWENPLPSELSMADIRVLAMVERLGGCMERRKSPEIVGLSHAESRSDIRVANIPYVTLLTPGPDIKPGPRRLLSKETL